MKTKKPLKKAQNGAMVVKAMPKRPMIKDVPSVSGNPAQKPASMSKATPAMKNPYSDPQADKENVKPASPSSQRKMEKAYKKKVKSNNGLSPYTTGASFKTGGVVNPNAKISADKTAGSKGVKSGVNPKAAASKVAKGRVGGTSKAPKTAAPKAKMGGSMKGKKC